MNKINYYLVFISLFIVLFIDGLGTSIVLPLFSDLFLHSETSILDKNVSLAVRHYMYGISLVSFSLGMFFSSPILGQLSDKFGRKKIIILSLIGTAIGYLICGYAIVLRSPIWFIIGRIIDGLTAGNIPIAQAAINDITPEKKRTGNMGLVLFAVTSGYFFGPLLSDFFSHHINGINLSLPFYATAGLSLLSIFMLMFLKEKSILNKSKINWMKCLSFISVLKDLKSLNKLLFIFITFQLGWSMYFQYLPLFMEAKHLEHEIVRLLTFIGFGMCFSFSILTRIFQSVSNTKKAALFTIAIILFTTCAQLYGYESTHIMWVASILGATGYGLAYSYLMTILSQEADINRQGQVMGIAASMSALSAVITALIGAYISNISADSVYIFANICFFASAIGLIKLLCKPKMVVFDGQ